MLNLSLFTTGYCVVAANDVLRGVPRRPMHCHALVGLIEHPRYGLSLFDTGYAQRIWAATQVWPYRLYRRITPMVLDPALEAVAQLRQRGLDPSAIQRVIISHLHPDHVAGLYDFPQAELILTVEALASVQGLRGLAALRRGHLPDLLPADLTRRARLLPGFTGPPLPELGPTYDLFGDGSLRLVQLPGHAYGQIGALLTTTTGPVLLAADGAWTNQSIRELRPPSRLASLIAADQRALHTTLVALHAFSLAHPEVRIIPTHCPEVYARFVDPSGS
ncbi:MAG: MBL fold metallo-hydrolase [Oscillochloridaceae bacterium umkhey_bin13]